MTFAQSLKVLDRYERQSIMGHSAGRVIHLLLLLLWLLFIILFVFFYIFSSSVFFHSSVERCARFTRTPSSLAPASPGAVPCHLKGRQKRQTPHSGRRRERVRTCNSGRQASVAMCRVDGGARHRRKQANIHQGARGGVYEHWAVGPRGFYTD